jgi:uncharacterized protein (DUF2062 family)
MPRPRKIDYPTWWSWRQAHKAWLREHGGRIWTTVLLALVLGALSRSLVGFLVIACVAIVGTVWARSRS